MGGTAYGSLGGSWQPIYFDAEWVIDAWLFDGHSNYGVFINPEYTGSGYAFQVGTSEGSTSYRPKLRIEYHWAGSSGQYITYTPQYDLEYWYCNGSNQGCQNENSGSVQVGRTEIHCQNELLIPKFRFDIKESDF